MNHMSSHLKNVNIQSMNGLFSLFSCQTRHNSFWTACLEKEISKNQFFLFTVNTGVSEKFCNILVMLVCDAYYYFFFKLVILGSLGTLALSPFNHYYQFYFKQTTTMGQSGPGSNGNSSSDCLVSYPGHSLRKSYLSAEMQLIYSAALADRASLLGIFF